MIASLESLPPYEYRAVTVPANVPDGFFEKPIKQPPGYGAENAFSTIEEAEADGWTYDERSARWSMPSDFQRELKRTQKWCKKLAGDAADAMDLDALRDALQKLKEWKGEKGRLRILPPSFDNEHLPTDEVGLLQRFVRWTTGAGYADVLSDDEDSMRAAVKERASALEKFLKRVRKDTYHEQLLAASETGVEPKGSGTLKCGNLACEDRDVSRVKKCSRCGIVAYCSKECQVAHWPVHKALCDEQKLTHAETGKSPLEKDNNTLEWYSSLSFIPHLVLIQAW